jgi:DNA repair exonuclease SbcCD nuclease subunit
MNKVILLGDTHWGNNNDSLIFHEHFKKFYDHLFSYIKKNNIKTIIQLGDLFDKRKNINFLTLHRAREIFFDRLSEHGVHLYVLAGNHDCTYKNTNEVNSVRLLATDRMTIVDQNPETVNIDGVDIDFFPWLNEDNLSLAKTLIENSSSKLAVGHFEFAAFPMHPGQLAESGMDHRLLSRYVAVYSGHYHTISSRDNVLYTGTPYELNWSDVDDPKGFWVIDIDDATVHPEFVQTPFKLYASIVYDDVSGEIDRDINVKDMFVKLVVVNKQDQYSFDSYVSKLNSMSPYNLRIVESNISQSIAAALNSKIEFKSTNEMINHVVDGMELKVDRNILKSMIADIYTEASELAKL